MSYDIHEYTDEQCFGILDLNNPSDRELEMKILQQMDKYEGKSKRLYQFFEQMYDRFFADEEEDVVEGFAVATEDGRQVIQTGPEDARRSGTGQISDNLPSGMDTSGNVEIKKIDDAVVAKASATDTRLVDYVKDPKKLNPTSQKTIFKMISIDSQYREDAQNTSATNFSLNLSEDLRNVISMKLYSVQIPYTWYTINNDFGSNYFYLKGNSPGIDNGQHDVKVQIRSGTYTAQQIATAINTSIRTLKAKTISDPQYKSIYDLSFGQTHISYNTADSQSSKILFEFDLKKIFDETDYALYFPNWSSPNVIGAGKSISIPSFLGYNTNTYFPYIAYSDASNNFDLTDSPFTVSSSNNSFSIIQYTSQYRYNENNADRVIHETIGVTLETGDYTRGNLIAAVNTAITSNPKLDSIYSFFRLTTIAESTNILYGKKRFELATKLNRASTNQIEGSKLAIVFPNESAIWTGPASCFRFPTRVAELTNIVSETPTSITNYNIPENTNIVLKCILTGYDISFNHFKTTLTPRNNYTLSEYKDEINASMKTGFIDLSNNLPVDAVLSAGTSFNFVDSYPTFTFDISRNFTEQNYIIDLCGSIFSSNIFNFGEDGNIGIFNQHYTQTRQAINVNNYQITNNNNTIWLRSKNSTNGFDNSFGNHNAPDILINLTQRTYSGSNAIGDFCAGINQDFANSGIMAGSEISAVGTSFTLKLKVNKTLTENDYAVYFEGSTWQSNFGLTPSPQYYSLPTSVITGPNQIFNNLITLSTINKNNQIIFRPVNPALAGGNDIVFEIETGIYTRTELIAEINTMFENNPITAKSTISIDDTNISTLQMNINNKYTSADFRLVFYDIYSFVYCNVGVSNVRNVKWDTTLGWTLGFHTYTEYELSVFAGLGPGKISANILSEEYQNYYSNIYGRITADDSPTDPGDVTNMGGINTQAIYANSNNIDGRIAIIGDSVCNTNLYNYFLLVVDDFIQNHVNDGLITIASVENDVALPSYASRVSYQCDPITGRKVAGIGTNNQFTTLTAKQLYSMNQVIDARRSSSSYTAGPYMRDVFALIPIKLAGLSFGSTYMEFGGTLQNQNRKYFGPVNIKKLSVKLMNDRGDVVDLNGTNWSFTLICEFMNDST
jgi:hypothetical protein